MIQLKKLLFEIQDIELKQIIKQIEMSEFKYIASGDNGRVYKLNNKDLLPKITTSTDEIEVARKLENNIGKYSTFIPVYYVGNLIGKKINYKNVIIMSNADLLPITVKQKIDNLVSKFKQYSYDHSGEVSLFDFVDNIDIKQLDVSILNFINSLRVDIQKLNIEDLDLDLDFKSENIMIWNNNMVMIDW